jgi:hypothetical protein
MLQCGLPRKVKKNTLRLLDFYCYAWSRSASA